ncbi:MAG: hypothetical protein LCH26_03695 [Proteobacteria bacterium]|nr:hypothetical protein [Pseudomonadota bacterium]
MSPRLTVLLLFVLCAPVWSKGDFASFVPPGWLLLDKAQGDLAGEGRQDVALVIAQNDPERIKENKEGLGSETINTNPRALLILFQEVGGAFRLVLTHKTMIPPEGDEHSPCLADPFQSVAITKGRLILSYQSWSSCGTWSASQFETIFRYEKETQGFRLIGAQRTDFHRATGEGTHTSTNYLTGKKKITKTHMGDDGSAKPHVAWTKTSCHEPVYLHQMEGFFPPE